MKKEKKAEAEAEEEEEEEEKKKKKNETRLYTQQHQLHVDGQGHCVSDSFLTKISTA